MKKSQLNLACQRRAQLVIKTNKKLKAEIFFVTRPSTCRKLDSCFWSMWKDKKWIKSYFVT